MARNWKRAHDNVKALLDGERTRMFTLANEVASERGAKLTALGRINDLNLKLGWAQRRLHEAAEGLATLGKHSAASSLHADAYDLTPSAVKAEAGVERR